MGVWAKGGNSSPHRERKNHETRRNSARCFEITWQQNKSMHGGVQDVAPAYQGSRDVVPRLWRRQHVPTTSSDNGYPYCFPDGSRWVSTETGRRNRKNQNNQISCHDKFLTPYCLLEESEGSRDQGILCLLAAFKGATAQLALAFGAANYS